MQERPPRTPIDELPWYKSPYTWGLIVGIITLTLMRPCTRYEPEPLPVLGPVPGWLSEATAPPGGAAIVVFYADACDACVKNVEALADLSRRFSRTPYSANLYVAHEEETDLSLPRDLLAYEPEWKSIAIRPPADWRSGGFSHALWDGRALPSIWTDFIQIGSVWIIDGQASLRGPLGTSDPTAIDEVYYRVQHVLRAASKHSIGGP